MKKFEDVQIQVRFTDLDGYGHVNNSVCITYLEIARNTTFKEELLRARDEGHWFVIVETRIKYKKFIQFEDNVYVSLKLTNAKGAKFEFEYVVHDGNGTTFAEATTVHATYDANSQRPMRVPEYLMAVAE